MILLQKKEANANVIGFFHLDEVQTYWCQENNELGYVCIPCLCIYLYFRTMVMNQKKNHTTYVLNSSTYINIMNTCNVTHSTLKLNSLTYLEIFPLINPKSKNNNGMVVKKRTNSLNPFSLHFYFHDNSFNLKMKIVEKQWIRVVCCFCSYTLHCINKNLFLIIGTKAFIRFDFRLG